MRSTNFVHIKPMGTMQLPLVGEFDIDYLYHEPKRLDNYTIRLHFKQHNQKIMHLSGEQAFDEWLEWLMLRLST